MAFDIHRRSSDILQKGQVGFNGLVVPDNRNIERSFTLVGGQASQLDRIAVGGTPADGDVIAFTIARAIDSSSAAFSLTLTTTTAASTATAAQAIVDAFNADASFTKMAFASRIGSNVALTAIFPGADYAFTTTLGTPPVGATLTLSTGGTLGSTAAADATDALFCDVLMASPVIASNYLDVAADFGHDSERIGELICGKFGAAVTLAPRTATLDIAGVHDNNKKMLIHITSNGHQDELYTVSSGTVDLATFAGAIVSAIQGTSAIVGAAVADTDNVLLTALEINGELNVSAVMVDVSTITVGVTESADPIAGGTQESMVGIVVYDPTDADTDVLGSNSAGVKAGTEGRMLEEGYFLMKPTDSAAFDAVFNKPVYVGQTGTETGRIFLTAGTDRVKWLRCIVKQAVRGGFYVLRLLPLRDR